MTDRVYPSAKPTTPNGATTNGGSTTTNGGTNHAFPTNKAQLYNAARPAYRPIPPPRRRRGRSCCCCCCLWTTFLIITILLLAAIAGAIFWFIYRPQRPNFTVNNLQLTQFNVTSTNLISKLNITVSARNPNGKMTYYYDPISVSISSNEVEIGDGSFPGFSHGSKNTTSLKTVLSSPDQTLDSSTISKLRSDIKNKKNLPLKIQLDTKVSAKVGSVKSKKIPIRVTCEGVQVGLPTGKSAATAKTNGVKCKVDLRVKILRWTF